MKDHSWVHLAREFQAIPQSAERLRGEWLAYQGSEDYGIWLLRPGGTETEEARAAFTLLAAEAMARLGIAPLPVPQPEQHFPDWGRFIGHFQEKAERAGRTTDLSGSVPYGLGKEDRDAVDPSTRAWLEWLRRNSPAFQSAEGDFRIDDQVYPSREGSIEDLCLASAAACKRLAREETRDRHKQRLKHAGSAQATRGISQNRAKRRQDVINPILQRKRWTRGRLVTQSGVGKATVYEYLDGTRASISKANRQALAEELDLTSDQLPL